MFCNSQRGLGIPMDFAVLDKKNRVQVIARVQEGSKEGPPLFGLQRAKTEISLRIAIDDEVHTRVAEVADSVEEYRGLLAHAPPVYTIRLNSGSVYAPIGIRLHREHDVHRS